MKTRNVASRAVVYVILVVALIYTVLPLLTIVVTSLRSEADMNQGPFTIPRDFNIIGNFQRAWTVGRIGLYAANSIAISVPTVLLVVAFSTLAGYSFARLRFPGRTGLFFLLLMGLMVPFQSVMIPLYYLLNSLKLLDKRIAVVLVIAVAGLPFGTFMLRSFFMGISDELSEAAKLDGCGDWRIFFHVMLPLTYPAWGSLIIFQAMWTWNEFLVPLLFIYSEEKRPIPLGLMYFQGRYQVEYTVIAAAILIAILPLAVLYILLQRRFTTGLVAGALKG
jgi:raffinose/stachyose/melibiose transport system permease protein